jgi:hypothetical protein
VSDAFVIEDWIPFLDRVTFVISTMEPLPFFHGGLPHNFHGGPHTVFPRRTGV